MTQRAILPSQEQLKRLFDYDPVSGVLTWRFRTGHWQHIGAHNARFSGKPAGSIATKGTNRYLVVEIDGGPRYAHRVIFKWVTGKEPPRILDHIDCDGLNNKWSNIRIASDHGNQGNRRKQRRQAKGVSITPTGRYRAYITRDGRFVHLGTFDTENEGAIAYKKAAMDYFGEFART